MKKASLLLTLIFLLLNLSSCYTTRNIDYDTALNSGSNIEARCNIDPEKGFRTKFAEYCSSKRITYSYDSLDKTYTISPDYKESFLFDTPNRNKPYLVITKDGDVYPIMMFYYSGSDWIFFDTIKIYGKSNTYQITDFYFDKISDVKEGYVVERYTRIMRPEFMEFLRDDFLKGDSKTIRLIGDYTRTVKFTNDAVAGIQALVDLYFTLTE